MAKKFSLNSTRPPGLKDFLGKHFIYTYENAWQYELYIRNDHTIDYRILSGIAVGRWVRNQRAHIVRIAKEVVKISWNEPTGKSESIVFNVVERRAHGVIFFPRLIADDPLKTIYFQKDGAGEMLWLRDPGPTYPMLLVDEFARIFFIEDCGLNNEQVINCGVDQLPEGYATRTNLQLSRSQNYKA